MTLMTPADHRRGLAPGCGLPLAWRATRTAPSAVLKAGARVGGDRSWHRPGDLLVGAQVVLTVGLPGGRGGCCWPASCA